MTVQQIESELIKLPPQERLKLAHFLLESLVTEKRVGESDYEINSVEWLTLAESSLAFWDNPEDAYYDSL